MKDYFGECHCGEIRFKFTSEDSVDIWKCNCSICEIHGFEHLFIIKKAAAGEEKN